MNKRSNEMPELARFYKIIIRMQYSDIGQHNKPHFHAFHGEYEASINTYKKSSTLSSTAVYLPLVPKTGLEPVRGSLPEGF